MSAIHATRAAGGSHGEAMPTRDGWLAGLPWLAALLVLLLSARMLAAQPSADQADQWLEDARQDYLDGRYDEALPVLRDFAETNSPIAQNILGLMHLNGDGVPADPAEARRLFFLAADAGLPQAMHNHAGL